jgi:hypothetical protein
MSEEKIYCCNCKKEVKARLTSGREIYPHRKDLYSLPFWKCDDCGQFVGCHHKTKDKTKPLGVIPSQEIKSIRSEIHRILDPIWKMGKMRRSDLYKLLTKRLGRQYHTAGLRSVDEAEMIVCEVKDIRRSLGMVTF